MVSCILVAAICGATQAQAGTPWHVAYDLRMNETAPPLMLSAQNQTMLGVLMDILKDPHGAGVLLQAMRRPCDMLFHDMLPTKAIPRQLCWGLPQPTAGNAPA